MWKFQEISVIQLLREIKFGVFRVSKLAVFEQLEALDVDLF